MAALSAHLFSTYSPGDVVYDKTYEEWTAKWWQSYLWSDKKRATKEPVFMIPGKLMETPKEQSIECRICEIESHKPILMTVINWVSMERQPTEIGDRVQRVESPKFKLGYCDAVSHGYWFFFKPYAFPPGEYMINSFGCCSLGKTKVAIDYKLTIIEPKGRR